MAVWTDAAKPYGTRVSELLGVLSPTVTKDNAVDWLYGQTDRDWLVADPADQTPGWDQATETKTVIS
jgi:hypothetical protein